MTEAHKRKIRAGIKRARAKRRAEGRMARSAGAAKKRGRKPRSGFLAILAAVETLRALPAGDRAALLKLL